MKRFAVFVASIVVAWLAVSVLVGLTFGLIGNPFASMFTTTSAVVAANGLTILVLTVLFARFLYKSWSRRWLEPKVPVPPRVEG